MKEVYAVILDEGGNNWNMGVFSTYTKAQACVEQMNELAGETLSYVSIIHFEVDRAYLDGFPLSAGQ